MRALAASWTGFGWLSAAAGAAAVALAVAGGAEVLRVHDVAEMRQAARVAHAVSVHAPRVDVGGGG